MKRESFVVPKEREDVGTHHRKKKKTKKKTKTKKTRLSFFVSLFDSFFPTRKALFISKDRSSLGKRKALYHGNVVVVDIARL